MSSIHAAEAKSLRLLRLAACIAVSHIIIAVHALEARDGGSVSWRSLDVEARLDADAVLHVRERHELELSGDVTTF
jgi:hypothetical protein